MALTTRQQDILARLKKGDKPKDIAATLGITESGVYQHRRNFIKQGLLPKTGRKSSAKKGAARGLGNQGATLMRHDPTGKNGSGRYFNVTATTVRDTIDPVAVIANRIQVVKESVLERSDAVESALAVLEQATGDLEALGAEAQRLEKALKILAPSSNGSRKTTRRRRPKATPLQQVVLA